MSQTLEADYGSNEDEQEASETQYKSPEDKLFTADMEFEPEYEDATMTHRYNQLKRYTKTSLNTVTVLGAETVTEDKVSLLVENGRRESTIDFHSSDSYGRPNVEELLSVTDANKFRYMKGEEITMFPSGGHNISGCSDLTDRISRKLKILSVRMGLGGIASRNHPYAQVDSLVPTSVGFALVSAVSVASATSLVTTGFLVTGNILLSLVLFATMFALLVASSGIIGTFGAMSLLYVLFGDT